MVPGLEMTSLYLSCGLCDSKRPQSTPKRVVHKKCKFYGKRNFNVIYGAILHYDQCSFGPPQQFDMVLGLEMTSLYLSCGLCNSIRPQSTRKRLVNKKCKYYGKHNFKVIYGAILHYDQGSLGTPHRFDMVL
eukprot:scaffold102322_cov46-Attheya_sp.AAC.1